MTMLEEASEIAPAVALPDFLESQETPQERAWNDFLTMIAEGRQIVLSKAEHDRRVIVSVARLYECHTSDWSYFLSTKKIGTGRPAKSEFHHIVVYALNAMGDKTGRSTVVCAVLDEWVSTKPRPAPDEIPAWMKAQGGRDEIYKRRRDRERHRPTRDERDSAVHELISLPPIDTTPLPAPFAALDGDHLVLAHFDSIRQKIQIRAVVRKIDQAWLRANALDILAGRQWLPPAPIQPDGPIDEFFTKPEVAAGLHRKTLEIVSDRPAFRAVTRWLEPSAGAGAFSNLLPENKLCIDIAPKAPGIIQHDFLTFRDFGQYCYFCIGNPPFTNGAAIRFFNYAARVSAYIAFVVSETFARPSVQRKLARHFHLLATLPMPDMAFLHGGRGCSVPTIFQIWERRDELRPLPPRETADECADLEFLPSSEGATYIIQNLGENAGRSLPLGSKASPQSHFFIRCDEAAVAILNSIKWPPRTGVVRNLSKAEIIRTYKVKKRSQLSKFTH
jgi:hypothetical protein